jgi:hypothetical protein
MRRIECAARAYAPADSGKNAHPSFRKGRPCTVSSRGPLPPVPRATKPSFAVYFVAAAIRGGYGSLVSNNLQSTVSKPTVR